MSAQTREYDLVVIGGGPAGVFGATAATAFGKTVALVDCHHELDCGHLVMTITCDSNRRPVKKKPKLFDFSRPDVPLRAGGGGDECH